MPGCCGEDLCKNCQIDEDNDIAFSIKQDDCQYLEIKEEYRIMLFSMKSMWFKSRTVLDVACWVLFSLLRVKSSLVETQRTHVCHFNTVSCLVGALKAYGHDRNWEQISDAMFSAVKVGNLSLAEDAKLYGIEPDECLMEDCPEA